jgi:small subunit ribosomal protein S17
MPNNRKRLQGTVVSNKMDKTVTVEIERLKSHRIYEKVLITTKKVLAHDETNEVPLGAVVRIVESRPLSKRKRWVVESIVMDPGNKVVESIADEAEVQAAEQIGRDVEPETTETDEEGEA